MATILVLIAFVLAAFAAFGLSAVGRVHLGWLALAFFFASLLVGHVVRLV